MAYVYGRNQENVTEASMLIQVSTMIHWLVPSYISLTKGDDHVLRLSLSLFFTPSLFSLYSLSLLFSQFSPFSLFFSLHLSLFLSLPLLPSLFSLLFSQFSPFISLFFSLHLSLFLSLVCSRLLSFFSISHIFLSLHPLSFSSHCRIS